MSLKDHIKSGIAGITLACGLAATAGLIGVGLGVLGGAAGMTALGLPLLIGGGCAYVGISLGSRLCGGLFRKGDTVKVMTFLLGAAAATYGILGNYAPTQNMVPYRDQVFGQKGELSQKFHHAVREANKHIIWPDMSVKPAHHRPSEP